MGEKVVIGPVDRGIKTDREPFLIDNDAFPILQNAYQWRGRVKRKRGTSLLGRLQRYVGTTNGSGNLTVTLAPSPIASGTVSFAVIGSSATDIFTDSGSGGSPVTLITNNASAMGQLTLSSGLLAITDSQPNAPVIYYPSLPVMGLEDLILQSTQYPGTIGFDTDYSYNISTVNPYNIYDVSFYKNPPAGAPYPGSYVAKATPPPITWNGTNYQQFWTTNYQGAFWATNGIQVPFNSSTIGMQFAPASTISAVSTTATTLTATISNSPLIVGDFVFMNEWTSGTAANASTLNFQTGYVTASSSGSTTPSSRTVTITFPNATIATDTYTPGIIQYLTTRVNTSIDCIRWYDGDPTNGVFPYSTLNSGLGWVNFTPPLSQSIYSIADLPSAQYYLVGARMMLPFKDRLLFFGPVVQSSLGNPIYLQDTVIYSQNGTPYYTASFPVNPTTGIVPTISFTPLLVPINQTAVPFAFWEDQTGYGGFISAGVAQPILTVSTNIDALIVGFSNSQTRLIYSGNDIVPFNFFLINNEFGSASTFSVINLDQGVLTRGNRGFTMTSQVSSQRFDLDIPDQEFQISAINNGSERVTAQRDFVSEWIYFTFPGDYNQANVFPNQTLLYNYRDDSWGMFNECYTTYGQFKRSTGLTWATLPSDLTWETWNTPWNSSATNLLQPQVIGGNQQGFVLIRETLETEEGNSLYIQNISGLTVTCPNHCLNNNDYIVISGVLGTMGSSINGMIFSVSVTSTSTFLLNGPAISGTYLGGGYIQRMYIPTIITKQFPVAWGMGRKTRLGPQQYLFSTTPFGQVTLLIFLSQNQDFGYNNSSVVPASEVTNNSLIYSTILYTCPESTNLGLTATNMANPANTSQMMNTIAGTSGIAVPILQQQTWHRMNTSLIGDTVQIGFTLSDAQMRDTTFSNQFVEIEFHGCILDVNPSSLLA